MKRLLKMAGIALGLLALALAWPAYQVFVELEKSRSEDPAVWEENVAALEAVTRARVAAGEVNPRDAVLFIGSSSIRFWETLAEDMAPLPVIQHGFGGAKLNDVVHYAGRLVNAWSPRAVVVFAGTNDIHPGEAKTPATLLASYQSFVASVRGTKPQLPVFFIAITPSPLRWEVWDIARETNRLVSAWSTTQAALYVIDTAPALLGADGAPDIDNYVFDGLHLSERGYARWTGVIRPFLLDVLGSP
jgi:hypothetical protein